MAEQGIKVEIDGREHWLPADLDLNDVVLLNEQDFGEGQAGWVASVRFMVWRVLLRDNPEVTIEEAGSKINFRQLMDDDAEAEGPPPVPLPEPDPLSGTSSDEGSGNGSTGTRAVTEIHGVGGLR